MIHHHPFKALDKLRELKASRPNAVNSSWHHQEALIMHEWSLRQYDVHMTPAKAMEESMAVGMEVAIHTHLLCNYQRVIVSMVM